ncbi:hypothetical protein AC578_8048 [Pseudocercospora eumusae]|uniref:DUF1479 domain protein n=1 Tax=Pseudocercospora eumusae TaxID=321146 RepID=A0A139GXC6_9PEZI|nr:hypothetical protein AC578_8048 [Pseudocercospora eumusae]
MSSVMKFWHLDDSDLPIDMSSQGHYADRFRIRKPDDKEYSLKSHLNSSAIQRWEDEKYRSNYEAIFRGDRESLDPWCMDNRPNAITDLYQAQGSCSAFHAMQGWLSMSNCGPREDTLRLLSSLKLTTASMMLRPFFTYDEEERFDPTQPAFPGATPGEDNSFLRRSFFLICNLKKTLFSVPKVRPGDYMFWHCDFAHEVESSQNGAENSSVFCNTSMPLFPYKIENMLRMRQDFRDVVPPRDFAKDFWGPCELEKDHVAREGNILSLEGRRASDLERFEDEEGLSSGQEAVKRMANEAMKE